MSQLQESSTQVERPAQDRTVQEGLSYLAVANDPAVRHVCVAAYPTVATTKPPSTKIVRRARPRQTSKDAPPKPKATPETKAAPAAPTQVATSEASNTTPKRAPSASLPRQRHVYAMPKNRYELLEHEQLEDFLNHENSVTEECIALPCKAPVHDAVTPDDKVDTVPPSMAPVSSDVVSPVSTTLRPSAVCPIQPSLCDPVPTTGRLSVSMRKRCNALIGRSLQYEVFSVCMHRVPTSVLTALSVRNVYEYLRRVPRKNLQWHGAFVCPRVKTTSHVYTHILAEGFLHLHTFQHQMLFYKPQHGQKPLYEQSNSQLHTISRAQPQVDDSQEPSNTPLHVYHITVKGKNKNVQAWIDSCASSSCISANVTRQLQLPTIPVSDMSCRVGDSRTIPVHELCIVDTSVGRLKCLVIPDLPCEIIIGLPWLKSVNPEIEWHTGVVHIPSSLHTLYPIGHSMTQSNNFSPMLLSAMQFKKLAKRHKQYETFLVTVDIPTTPEHVQCDVSVSTSHPHKDVLEPLISEFRDVFAVPSGLPPDRGPLNFSIKLQPDATPFARTPFRLSPAEDEELRRQLKELVEAKYVSPSVSPWGSPILFVRKKPNAEGKVELRMCIDYRALNSRTVRDQYPLPNIAELLNSAAGHKYYSSLDLRSGYHQMLMEEESRPLTSFVTKYGTYQFNVLPFGVANGPPAFSRLIKSLLGHVKGVITYMDDILIFSNTLEEHHVALRTVFDIMRKNQLYLKFSKCNFLQPQTKFLGHVLSHDGLHTDPSTISAVKDFPIPTNIQELRGFLGLANYYRKFIKSFAHIAQPLTDLLKGDNKHHISASWTSDVHTVAFDTIKDALCSAPVLRPYNPTHQTAMFTDASKFGVGVALCQRKDDSELWLPVEYGSKRFNDAESRYATHEQELLALVFGLRHFRHFLLGLRFTCYTDHKSLTRIHTQSSLSPRQARWLETLSEYDYVIKYVKGETNVVADALSRLFAIINMNGSEFIDEVRTAYASDPDLPELKHALHEADGLFFHGLQLYIPLALRIRCIEENHSSPWSSHPGYIRCHELISRSYWWPGMRRDIKQFVLSCPSCQANKPVNSLPRGKYSAFDHPESRWSVISTDLITDLPRTQDGHDAIITYVDKFSRMVHFVPCSKNITATEFAHVFISTVFRLHGMPDCIISDRDSRFTSAFWSEFTQALHIRLNMSSAHYPQTDGQSERMHRSLEQNLRHYCAYNQRSWNDYLPLAEFSINNLTNRSTGHSPFYLNYGQHPTVPGCFSSVMRRSAADNYTTTPAEQYLQDLHDAFERAHAMAERAAEQATTRANQQRLPVNFSVGDEVLLSTKHLNESILGSSKLRCQWIGPFKVKAARGINAFQLDLPPLLGRVHNTFHAHYLKLYHRNEDMHPSQLPPPPVLVDGTEEYEVSRVLAKRRMGRGVQYLIEFVGYSIEYAEWLPLRNLVNAKEAIAEFENRQVTDEE